jgi:hypothetical protein
MSRGHCSKPSLIRIEIWKVLITVGTHFERHVECKKADDESFVCSEKNLIVSSNLHYYVQKQVQLLSLLSTNKFIVFYSF